MRAMKKYELVIFDMDGTILYTLTDIVNGLNYALKKNHYPERTQEQVRKFIGNGIRHEVIHSLPKDVSEDVIDQVFDDFNEYYAVHCGDTTRPYEGVVELIEKLNQNGILTAVVSNKGDYAVQQLMEQYFPKLFKMGVGEKKGVRRKPYPDTVNEVLKALDIKCENAVYIGDCEVDIETAKNASMDGIIVEWGYRDHDFLVEHGAQVLVKDVEELKNILL